MNAVQCDYCGKHGCTSAHLPVSKRDKIVFLLNHWDDIFAPPISGVGGSGNGSDTPHLSPMSRHASVVELARCVTLLRSEARVQAAHLMASHRAEWRVHTWTETKRRKGGKTETVTRRERQRMVPGWVDHGKVRRGEERLCELFRGPVFVPEDLWDAARLSSAEIEEKRRRRTRVSVAA